MSTSHNWEEAPRNRVRPYRGKEVRGKFFVHDSLFLSLSNPLLDYNPNRLMGKYEFGNWENCGVIANRRLCSSSRVLDKEISMRHLRPESWQGRSFLRLSKWQIMRELAGNGQRREAPWRQTDEGRGQCKITHTFYEQTSSLSSPPDPRIEWRERTQDSRVQGTVYFGKKKWLWERAENF